MPAPTVEWPQESRNGLNNPQSAMNEYSGLTVVVPTRNRASLACTSISSVIEQGAADIRIVVSDNSTDPDDAEILRSFCASQESGRVAYFRVPEPLPMSAHWQWALERSASFSGHGHFTFLTDRMILRPHAMRRLVDVVTLHPTDVISYNHDRVDDFRYPVRLHLGPWTGRLLELDASSLLRLASQGEFPAALPRMLNCVVPRPILNAVASHFGAVFGSTSPDFCFAFRCLAVVDHIHYLDEALLLHYAVDRSNGANMARGTQSADRLDFSAQLGPTHAWAVPEPRLETLTNACTHEYSIVRAECGSPKFPAIDIAAYLDANERDVMAIQDPELLRAMRDVMASHGRTMGQARLRLLTSKIRQARRDPLKGFRWLLSLVLGRSALQPIWIRLSKFGILPPSCKWFNFASAPEAIAHARRFPRRRTESMAHLELLAWRRSERITP